MIIEGENIEYDGRPVASLIRYYRRLAVLAIQLSVLNWLPWEIHRLKKHVKDLLFKE